MIVSQAMLSLDSFIVAIGLSGVLPRRQMPWFAALVGLGDAAASMLGPRLGLVVPMPQEMLAACLMLWGCLGIGRWRTVWVREAWRSGWPAGVLLPLLSADNLLAPASDPLLSGVCSAAMCAAGFAVGGFFSARPPGGSSRWWVGLPLTLSGAVLLIRS